MAHVVDLKNAVNREEYGGKAANLSRLLAAGLPVPSGFAVGVSAFGDERLLPESVSEMRRVLDASKLYAVRSSAVNEDAADASWAGQFETFLQVKPEDVPATIEKCHRSSEDRAKAYEKKMTDTNEDFKIAVVVQEMLTPEYAGVLFTRNPMTGANELVIEYVSGMGEKLVSGKADPTHLIVKEGSDEQAPFDLEKLAELARLVEKTFGAPQDIEFACQNNAVWLLQSRPITTLPTYDTFDLGDPADLFYWGPSRTEPLYMSDFMVAAGDVFKEQHADTAWPSPPKSIVLFHDNQMVWLSNSKAFNTYAANAFEAYLRTRNASEEFSAWSQLCEQADGAAENTSRIFDALVSAWKKTIHAEFSLYGAEILIGSMLARLTESERQHVWQEFTLPDQPSFLQRIDNEILSGEDIEALAKKYPWIQDGYFGVTGNAAEYFGKRRLEISGKTVSKVGSSSRRDALAKKLGLSQREIDALDLARNLAKFMDDRKAWMMRTRTYLTALKKSPGPSDGWLYDTGSIVLFDEDKAGILWKRYVDYKTIRGDLKGTVASRAEADTVEGEVVVVDSPHAIVDNQKILVTPSTSPSYVPLMRNAKALITNHGGMMSHAAIVAREFGLPCIVGTKTATKQLRSGDRVVMDMQSGAIQRSN